MKTFTLTTLIIFGILSSCTNKKENRELAPYHDKPPYDHNELAEPDNDENITASDHNIDTSKIENLDKPKNQTDLDTTLLFQAWTIDPDDLHASFKISEESFFITDANGDGNMPYTLFNRNLTIYYPESEQGGEIISLTKNKMVIKWYEIDEPITYIAWKS